MKKKKKVKRTNFQSGLMEEEEEDEGDDDGDGDDDDDEDDEQMKRKRNPPAGIRKVQARTDFFDQNTDYKTKDDDD
ncbi:hypothetical protein TWF730_008221 [Orbilia blumenaviensis]|uniref:Uncharacterized protein n=1 Tax=Orbilia blumenaviensis TaxID=1796055 RepID=A0AAV9V4Q2_9PEZI